MKPLNHTSPQSLPSWLSITCSEFKAREPLSWVNWASKNLCEFFYKPFATWYCMKVTPPSNECSPWKRMEVTLRWYRSHCFCWVNQVVFNAKFLTFTREKQRGLYQSITSSLACIHRPGYWADNRKIAYWKPVQKEYIDGSGERVTLLPERKTILLSSSLVWFSGSLVSIIGSKSQNLLICRSRKL